MNVCNYADDTTFYACDSDICNLIKRLEHDSSSAFEWFQSNYMKLNEDKCHFIIPGYKHEIMFASIGESRIWEKGQQKLLGVIVDKNLKFKELILKQCTKAGKKISVLGKVCHILHLDRRRLLMKTFIESQFGYCPLVWMFCGRQENNRINHLYERALRIVYNDSSQLLKICLN